MNIVLLNKISFNFIFNQNNHNKSLLGIFKVDNLLLTCKMAMIHIVLGNKSKVSKGLNRTQLKHILENIRLSSTDRISFAYLSFKQVFNYDYK